MSNINNSNDSFQSGDCCVQNTAGYSIDVSQDVGAGDAVVQPYDSSCMEPVSRGGGKKKKSSRRRSARRSSRRSARRSPRRSARRSSRRSNRKGYCRRRGAYCTKNGCKCGQIKQGGGSIGGGCDICGI